MTPAAVNFDSVSKPRRTLAEIDCRIVALVASLAIWQARADHAAMESKKRGSADEPKSSS